ncbi:MAG: hypothetical protein GSR80_001062 [Desulfurococcales archaeon]|nr:hypothetical protein [Desulfurococcales archaeon]
MCRLLAGVAWGGEGLRLLAGLAGLLARAAERDPLLARATGGRRWSHCHGYGILLAARRGASWRVYYERFDAWAPGLPEGGVCRANLEALKAAVERLPRLLEGAREALLVLHARLASPGEPRGTLNAHPFRVEAHTQAGPVEVYLAHNGSVEKEPLARLHGLDPRAYTDTHILAIHTAARLSEGRSIPEAISEVEERGLVKTALDLAVAILHPTGPPELYVNGYISPELREDPAKLEYYKPILLEASQLRAYASTTIAQLATSQGLPLEAHTLNGTQKLEPAIRQ